MRLGILLVLGACGRLGFDARPGGDAGGDAGHDGPVDAAGPPCELTGFSGPASFATGTSPYGVVIGDFEDNGRLDFAVVAYSNDRVDVFLAGATAGTFARTSYAAGDGAIDVATSDVTGDGILDLVTANNIAATSSTLIGNGDGTFQPAIGSPAGAGTYGIATGNFAGSMLRDVVVTNLDARTVGIWSSNGDGTYTANTQTVTSGAISVEAADLDGDGDDDVVATGNGGVVVMLNLRGVWSAETYYPTGAMPTGVAVAHLDGDGVLDLAVANRSSNTLSTLRGNGDGTFQAKIDHPAVGQPYAIAAGDLNRDGAMDLVTANFGGDSVSYFLGEASGAFTRSELPAQNGPNGIALGDLSRDGVIDIVVTSDGDALATLFYGLCP